MNKKIPPIQETLPEVFIIESLSFEDEVSKNYEGKILYHLLKMCNKNPIYFYFRTGLELKTLLNEFRSSGYRFLHFSCHGSSTQIKTTLERIDYKDFVADLEGLLKNRRLFLSGCELGNELLHSMIFGKNIGMYSIIGPKDPIRFDVSAALWSAFYVKLFLIDQDYVKKSLIVDSLKSLCELYDLSLLFTWYDTCKEQIVSDTIDGTSKTVKKIEKLKKIEEESVL